MKRTQNRKILQIKNETLALGIDIAGGFTLLGI